MLKRLSGLSRTALDKTRRLLGTPTKQPDNSSESNRDEALSGNAAVSDPEPTSTGREQQTHSDSEGRKKSNSSRSRNGNRKRAQNKPKKPSPARKNAVRGGQQPLIVPAGEHSVTRKSIGRSALKVLDKLHEAGHSAYLVGGGVRDALVGLKPKDFDVATDASPETIRALFRNSRIIGRRFRLVHVVYGREIIEVATFRAAHDTGEGGEIGAAGRIVRDNVFGTIEEDAYRRDFSVNALYYNIADGSVVDYVGGLADLDRGVFQLIGEPKTRCEEDPVRVLRAVRLAAKLKFSIEPSTLEAMRATSSELSATPPPRLFEEVLKLFQGGYALRSFHSIREHDLLTYLFPLLDKRLKQGDEKLVSMLDAALTNTDKRVAQGKPITPYYLLAFMMWPDVQERATAECVDGSTINDALFTAADSVLATQLRITSIPRRLSGPMKEVWQMQPRLERLKGGRALKLMEDRRFRAAYDFLCLRSTIDDRLKDSAAWWTKVQTLDEEGREKSASKRPTVDNIWPDKGNRGKAPASGPGSDAVSAASSSDKPPAKKRRRRRRKPAGGASAGPTSDAS